MSQNSTTDDIPNDILNELENLQPIILTQQLQQQKLLMESSAQGGPGSVNEALCILLDTCGVTVRNAARHCGISRTKLQKMLNGSGDLSPEVLGLLHDLCKSKKPHLFD